MPLTRRSFLLGAAVVAAATALAPYESVATSLADRVIKPLADGNEPTIALADSVEGDIWRELMALAPAPLPVTTVQLEREPIGVFARFDIQAVTQATMMEWRHLVRTEGIGASMGHLIYLATVPRDRFLWDHPEVQKLLHAPNGGEVISKLLTASERDLVCDKIAEVSGFAN